MSLIYSARARRDIEAALALTQSEFPSTLADFRRHFAAMIARISDWPLSGHPIPGRADLRAIPMVRYPYKLVYRVSVSTIEIVHFRHTSRQTPESWEGGR